VIGVGNDKLERERERERETERERERDYWALTVKQKLKWAAINHI
jgi:hypothetical protein